MQLASASTERGKARPVCLDTTDSAERLPAASVAATSSTKRNRASDAPPVGREHAAFERNAVGIATVWSIFYAIALVIAGAYGGVELLRRSLDVAVLP